MTATPSPSPAPPTVLFAGGGTGGHIFPNLAILERLKKHIPEANAVFAVSNRPLDTQILASHTLAYVALPARPLSIKPWLWPGIYQAFHESSRMVAAVLQQLNVKAVVATGGFVSGPAVDAARRLRIPAALVNLDAVPGKANRYLAAKASKVFTAYASPAIPDAEAIGLPLRQSALGPADKAAARRQLGLNPERETLLITAGSQGASTINRMMVELAGQSQTRKVLAGWQMLHLSGDKDREDLIAAYQAAGIPAKVLPFCDTMGLAWASATLAISRAGANSVAEVWANAVPTIFYPYPYHRDQHQKLNAEPLTRTGMAILMLDEIDPTVNARKLGPRLTALITNASQRYQMAEQMRATRPADGAAAVAGWVKGRL